MTPGDFVTLKIRGATPGRPLYVSGELLHEDATAVTIRRTVYDDWRGTERTADTRIEWKRILKVVTK